MGGAVRIGQSVKPVGVFLLGLLGGVAFGLLVVDGFTQQGDESPVANTTAAERQGAAAPARREALEPARPEGEVATPPLAGESIPDTALPLRLLGTLVAEPASQSQAVILDIEAVHHMVLREGEGLALYPDVRVHAIEPRRVLLQTPRGLEKLWLSRGEGSPALAGAATPEARFAPALPRERPLRSTAQLRRDRSLNVRPQVIEAMNQLAGHLAYDLEPLYDESGRIEGVRATSVAEAGLLEKAGIERDEIIRGVNGVVIDTPEAASRVLRDMASCEPVVGMVAGPMGDREVEINAGLLRQFGCVEVGG